MQRGARFTYRRSRRERDVRRASWRLAGICGAFLSAACALVIYLSPREGQKAVLTVYMRADCNACRRWVEYMQDKGFRTVLGSLTDLRTERGGLRLPPSFQAPLAARVDGFWIQGFVPAREIHLLIDHRLGKSVRGLAVAGMPGGAPGVNASVPTPFTVYAVMPGGMLRPIGTYNELMH